MLYPVTPIGVASIFSALKEKGRQVFFLDLCFKDDIASVIKSVIKNIEPGVIGISIRNIDSAAFLLPEFFLEIVKNAVSCCKKYSSSPVILGGAGFSIMPEEILEYCGADAGVIGEGENVFPEVINLIENKKDYTGLSGVVKKKNGSYISVNPCFIENLDELPFPERGIYDDKYLNFEFATPLGKFYGVESVQTKRGCCFDCIYCTYPIIEGSNVRLKNPGKVADEFEIIVRRGRAKSIEIVDNIFNFPQAHAEDICREIIKRNIKIKWSCTVNPGLMNEKLADLMVDAGCKRIEFGIDTASNEMIKSYQKGFDKDSIVQSSKWCRERDTIFSYYLIIGGPGENKNTIKETFDVMEQVDPPNCFVMLGIRIFPRTEIEKIAVNEGILKRGESLLFPKFYFSKDINEDAINILNDYSQKYRNWYFLGTRGMAVKDGINQVLEIGESK